MANNINIPQKSTGDFRTAAEDNTITDWINSPSKDTRTLSVISTTLTIPADGQGDFNDYTLSQNETWNVTPFSIGNVIWFNLITPGGFVITKGTGISNDINSLFGSVLAAGTYRVLMACLETASVDVAVPSLQGVDATQLTALTLGTPSVGNTEITIPFTNPNSSNEDQNQLYYKLATEPTTWTPGVIAATGTTTFPAQTGLTNDLEYDFKAVAEGSVTYSDSVDSNEVSATPLAILSNTKSLQTFSASTDSIINLVSTAYDFKSGTATLPGSISGWVKLPAGEVTYPFTDNTSSASNLALFISASTTFQQIRFLMYQAGSAANISVFSSAVINADTWYHFCITWDSSNTEGGLNMYIDGALDNGAKAGTSITEKGDAQTPIIGMNGFDDSTGNGFMDEFSFWDKELSLLEIQEIYNSGVPANLLDHSAVANLHSWFRFEDNANDSSANGRDGTEGTSVTYNADTP